MKHRIFIAINIPDKVKKALFSCQNNSKDKFDNLEVEDTVSWTERENLHITLLFLGHLTDEEMGEALQKIEDAVKEHCSFDILLKDIAYGPKNKDPKFIWVRGEKSNELSELQKDIEDSLKESFDVSGEPHSFSPHITLGRIKRWQFKKINPEDVPDISANLDIPFEVTSIEIMESLLLKKGPRYEILQSIKLK